MDKDKKDKGIIIIICTILSVALWIYVTNVENKIRTTEINKIPVELINEDALKSSNLAVMPGQELYVSLKVEGNTSDINQIKKSDFKVQVDLAEYVWKKGVNKVPVTIIDYPVSVNIKNTNALTVSINIDNYIEKSMKIESNINVTPREGYFASSAIISPEAVKVSGAESYVNMVNKLVLKDNLSDVYDNISAEYRIIPIDDEGKELTGINLSQETAKVEIKVSKGKAVKVNIPTVGELPNKLKLSSLKQNKETVELLGPKEVIDKINELSTESLDLSTITESKEVFLKIIVPENTTVAEGEEYIRVTVEVIKYISKDFNVSFSTKGLGEGLKFTPNVDKIKLIISGYERDINNINESNINASLDLSSYTTEGSFEKLPVITIEGITSEYNLDYIEAVSFKISKEKTEVPTQGSPQETDRNQGE